MEEATGYSALKRIVLERIRARIWPPGALMPGEVEIAAEFGLSRATVNRALSELADEGFLDRRKRAGTRVRPSPLRHARLEIPQVRQEIEAAGAAYGYALLSRGVAAADADLARRMSVLPGAALLQVECLHSADGAPFQFEQRWINLAVAPDAERADFLVQPPSEWLVEHMPFTNADFSFSAAGADAEAARHLAAQPGAALFVAERITWLGEASITFARMTFREGYRMTTRI